MKSTTRRTAKHTRTPNGSEMNTRITHMRMVEDTRRQEGYLRAQKLQPDNILNTFDKFSGIVAPIHDCKCRPVPAMLKTDALARFPRKEKADSNYQKVADLLRRLYNQSEKNANLLAICKTMLLNKITMGIEPAYSEASVLTSFVANLRALQELLDTSCVGYKYLCDLLLTTGHIPLILDAMC